MTATLRVRSRLAALIAIPFAAACGETAAPPVPTSLAVVAPAPATATVGSSLTTSVKVLDDKGKPMRGVAVNFEPSAGGTVAATQATTDATGVATNSWTLGTATGENRLVATSGSLTPVTFTVNARADVAATMVAAAGNPAAGTVGSVLNPAPGVKLTDRHGNPVQGMLVTFSGPGAISGTQQNTDSEGIARPANWTLGGLVGVQNLRATAGTLTLLLPVTATAGPPTVLLPVNGNLQNAAPGAILPVPLTVRVTDAFSNAIQGVQVTFAVTSGNGSLSGTTAITDAGGNATSGAWRLGPIQGVQTVTATFAGSSTTATFTATAVDPGARSMTRFAGEGTTCPVSSTGCLFSVIVRDGLDRPVQGETVTWTNGTQTQVTTTNSQGRASVANLVTSASAGTAQQRARLMSTGQEIVFNYEFVTGGNYTIDLRFIVAPTGAQMTAFTEAKARWEQVITGDIPPFTLNEPARTCGPVNLPALNETVDDLVIYVQVDSIDGPGQVLGAAGPCYIRTPSGMPILGVMRLDRADLTLMETNGTLRDVITHEMGHVLGIGTLWQFSTFSHLLVGALGDDPQFMGTRAIPSFQLTGGILAGVPVENSGGQGTRDSHWRESTFDRELMTGFIDANGANPLSIITIGSLMDMGYQVNFGVADAYTCASTNTTICQPVIGGMLNLRANAGTSFRLNELPMPRPMVVR
jgi:hypothetical protein